MSYPFPYAVTRGSRYFIEDSSEIWALSIREVLKNPGIHSRQKITRNLQTSYRMLIKVADES